MWAKLNKDIEYSSENPRFETICIRIFDLVFVHFQKRYFITRRCFLIILPDNMCMSGRKSMTVKELPAKFFYVHIRQTGLSRMNHLLYVNELYIRIFLLNNIINFCLTLSHSSANESAVYDAQINRGRNK